MRRDWGGVGLAAVVIAALTLLVAFCAALPQPAEAATPSKKQICSVHNNGDSTITKTVKKYDVTNDKKKDKVTVKVAGNHKVGVAHNYKLSIFINGKRALKATIGNDACYCNVYQLTLKNGKKFLYIDSGGDYDADKLVGVFKYSKGKLKAVQTNRSAGTNIDNSWCRNIEVSENTVKITFSGFARSLSDHPLDWTYYLKYKKGTLKRTGTAANSFRIDGTNNSNSLTTSRNIKAKTSASDKAKSKTLKKNTKVRITKVVVKNKAMWFKAKTKSGATYWIKNSNQKCFKSMYE